MDSVFVCLCVYVCVLAPFLIWDAHNVDGWMDGVCVCVCVRMFVHVCSICHMSSFAQLEQYLHISSYVSQSQIAMYMFSVVARFV